MTTSGTTGPQRTGQPAPPPHAMLQVQSREDAAARGMIHCRNCGHDVDKRAIACPGCGVAPLVGTSFCWTCGAPTVANQVMCTQCGAAVSPGNVPSVAALPGSKSKVAAGLLGIFLGGFGVHKFYLGYTRAAVIMLVVSLAGSFATFGVAFAAVGLIGVIEGIIYLTKSDPDFDATYVQRKREWF